MPAQLAVPEPDFSEIHSVFLHSNVERAIAAARDVPVSEIRSLRPLWAVRALPALLLGSRALRVRGNRSVWETALAAGFAVLDERPDGFVLGHIGQQWRPNGGECPEFGDLEGFRSFDRPGFCRVAVSVGATCEDDGVRLTTETRVAATDDDARRRFGRYWIVIRPFSGLIRRGWLRAVRRAASIDPSV